MKDCIIIGAGASGISAALYLARYGHDVLVISEDVGGQAAVAGEVENYPAIKKTTGYKFSNLLKEQLALYKNVEVLLPSNAKKIDKSSDHFKVETDEGEYEAKTVLIAAGKESRKLNVPGEKELTGKGVSYCATCDGPFARDKGVVVVGGGNSAADSALMVAKVAKKVTLLTLEEELKAEQIKIDRIKKAINIGVINNAKTTALIEESGRLGKIEYESSQSGNKGKILCDMVFVEIGYVPRTKVFQGLVELNEKGEIKIDKMNQTSEEGIYAAGDITDVVWKQIVIACGEGAKAAMSINEYLEK